MTGKNLLPLLADPEARIYEEDDFVGYELANRRCSKATSSSIKASRLWEMGSGALQHCHRPW